MAGHCATRALSTMDLQAVNDEYDDLSDLGPSDLEDAEEWASRLTCNFSYFLPIFYFILLNLFNF